MTTILHTADLHLTSGTDKDYSLGVFAGIIALANRKRVSAILFAGDIFDTPADAEALRNDFRSILATLDPSILCYGVFGNHEYLASGHDTESFNFGRLVLPRPGPFERFVHDAWELIIIPPQTPSRTIIETTLPPPDSRFRIVMMHGMLLGALGGLESLTGSDDETDGKEGVFDPLVFQHLNAGYAALGHIHKPMEIAYTNGLAVYPGSARVCRKGETGPRSACLIEIDEKTQFRRVQIPASGEYRHYTARIEGSHIHFPDDTSGWKDSDWVHISIGGVAGDENTVMQEVDAFIAHLAADRKGVPLRKITTDTRDLLILSRLVGHPSVASFLDHMEKRKPDAPQEQETWNRALSLGIEAIRDSLKGSI